MYSVLRYIFLNIFIKIFVNIILGINVRNRNKLPSKGPAIIIANHNSHLDTMVLMTILPIQAQKVTRPVAAKEYFLKNPILAWFALKIIGIIPLSRTVNRTTTDLFTGCYNALENQNVIIFFPEGSRGEPEKLVVFKSGIARIAERFPTVPIIPVYMHGLGKALPKGEIVLVPFFCDIFVGDAIQWTSDKASFMKKLEVSMKSLKDESSYLT